MSLGSIYKSYNSESIINRIAEDEDVLFVAAAGNLGDSSRFYPASYDGVISVGSVDEDLYRSSFSNYNDQVNLVAPGNNILSLSTLPAITLTNDLGAEVSATVMKESVLPENIITAVPQDCGLGDEPCPLAYGKICVMARGEITFAEKARYCELSGGIAAIIYNNEQGNYFGTLGDDSTLTIPVMSIAQEDGPMALSARTIAIKLEEGAYVKMSGTSMAAPHVS